VTAVAGSDTRIAVTDAVFNVGEIYDWAVHPSCGAVVVFSGTVRDHAEGRTDVTHLTYEAYEDKAVQRMADIVAEARRQWPTIVRIAMLHRVGRLGLGESSVVVAVSSPHRPEAFEAARYCIDALKVAVPIWKQEEWSDGSDWGTGSHDISSIPTNGSVPK
jgi:molybdopterin synthase catalytic subunit